MRLVLTGGQVADVTQGAAFVAAVGAEQVVAGAVYDSNELVEAL